MMARAQPESLTAVCCMSNGARCSAPTCRDVGVGREGGARKILMVLASDVQN